MSGRFIALMLALALLAPAPVVANETVVIAAATLSPPIVKTLTGQRVDFVNRSGRAVHVEFGDDGQQHHVVQMPAGGPIWAVFHRPGTHPYVVHVYEGRETRTLTGVVDVGEDRTHKWDSQTCGVVVMGVCIEP